MGFPVQNTGNTLFWFWYSPDWGQTAWSFVADRRKYPVVAEDMSKTSNIVWANIVDAHKESKDNKAINNSHWRTYTEVAIAASE